MGLPKTKSNDRSKENINNDETKNEIDNCNDKDDLINDGSSLKLEYEE